MPFIRLFYCQLKVNFTGGSPQPPIDQNPGTRHPPASTMMSADSNVSDEESSVDMSNGEIATTLPAEKSCNDGVPISNSSNSPATTTTYQEIVEGDAKSLHKNNNEEPDLSNALDLEQAPSSTSAEPTPNDENNNIDPTLQKQSMELNVALESLESMRRLNIELEFGGSLQVQHDRCTYCQREALEKLKTNPPPPPPNPQIYKFT